MLWLAPTSHAWTASSSAGLSVGSRCPAERQDRQPKFRGSSHTPSTCAARPPSLAPHTWLSVSEARFVHRCCVVNQRATCIGMYVRRPRYRRPRLDPARVCGVTDYLTWSSSPLMSRHPVWTQKCRGCDKSCRFQSAVAQPWAIAAISLCELSNSCLYGRRARVGGFHATAAANPIRRARRPAETAFCIRAHARPPAGETVV